MRKLSIVLGLLITTSMLISCGNSNGNNEEEIVIGDEQETKADSSGNSTKTANDNTVTPATTTTDITSVKHSIAKVTEYENKSKVKLQETAKDEKNVSTRTKNFYVNEDGGIISLSQILHENSKDDYVLFEKVGTTSPIEKLMIAESSNGTLKFSSNNISGTLSKGILNINSNGEHKVYTLVRY